MRFIRNMRFIRSMRFIRNSPIGRPRISYSQWAAEVAAVATVVTAAMVPIAPAQTGADGYYAVTYIDVATTAVGQGVELIKKFRDASRREAGNLEFTTLQETSRPNRFVIMEGWQNQAAYEAHDKGATMSEFQAALMPIRNSPTNPHTLLPFANAGPRTIPPGVLYMVEHVDFRGGDPAVAEAAVAYVKALAESSQKEAGALRYDIYRRPAPRINHYEVVAAWTDAKAFDAHETAAHTVQFRNATAQGGRVWRVNLYDQRLYKAF
jgi:quinol monooxygenase YgiN